jgi:hypothetical protein
LPTSAENAASLRKGWFFAKETISRKNGSNDALKLRRKNYGLPSLLSD